jgi:hypothetical protein
MLAEKYMSIEHKDVPYRVIHNYRNKVLTFDMLKDWMFANLTCKALGRFMDKEPQTFEKSLTPPEVIQLREALAAVAAKHLAFDPRAHGTEEGGGVAWA